MGELLFSNDVYITFVVKVTFTCWGKITIRRKENYPNSHKTSFGKVTACNSKEPLQQNDIMRQFSHYFDIILFYVLSFITLVFTENIFQKLFKIVH